jgi:hypothetical protein
MMMMASLKHVQKFNKRTENETTALVASYTATHQVKLMYLYKHWKHALIYSVPTYDLHR